ncbi:uncharacterized protein LOC128445409 isoform X1 [Pleuronectes platessa]|uniref:uncharacterized protein LOC128445409 isoform X1 n=1 Tax=Pleuronectes platessa TaxID=8262 RepID=UPI00232A5014|nr:uncharacterized protein LOC128445409 isoform X1 [Pleuronectes platessa]
MLNILYFLLMLGFGRGTDELSFESKTVPIGDHFTLTCIRRFEGTMWWIRVVPGMLPEVLGKTSGFVSVDPRITARKEPGNFDLYIAGAKQSDTAVYYCMKRHFENLTFLKGTDLRVQGAGDMTSVPTSPAPPEPSVYLQCSVLSDTVNQKCPEEKCLSCFKDGSRTFDNIRGDGVDEYEENPEKLSTEKCSFLNNISSSEAATYFCALATCGARASGNGSKLNTEGVKTWNLQKDKVVIFLLFAALAICLVIIAILIYSIRKNSKTSDASVALQTNSTATGYLEGPQMDEDLLVYSTVNFKPGARDPKTAEEESIYSVRFLELD